MAVVALIPARGGSKGIPRKNLIACGGRPLIAHTITAALGSPSLSRVIVSTDDAEIAAVAQEFGAEVPFLRPAPLAQDDTPMVAVLRHVLDWLSENDGRPEAIVLLQPTSPLRQSRHISEAVCLFSDNSASSVVSVVEVPHQFNPLSVMTLKSGFLIPYLNDAVTPTRRQDKPRVYARNGPAVLVCSAKVLEKNELYGDRCLPYVMPREASLDIDDLFDLAMVESVMRSS